MGKQGLFIILLSTISFFIHKQLARTVLAKQFYGAMDFFDLLVSDGLIVVREVGINGPELVTLLCKHIRILGKPQKQCLPEWSDH